MRIIGGGDAIVKEESIGSKIRKLRIERKDTLMSLAKKLDIDFSSLSKIERSDREASADLIRKIVEVYLVDPKYFFGEGFTESEGQLLLEENLQPSELKKKYKFIVDGVEATEEEIKDAISLIRRYRNGS